MDFMMNSNRSSNVSSKNNTQEIMQNFAGTPSNVSSARSSVQSNSALSTTIESIDEHLEKWNTPQQRRLSALELSSYIKRKSSLSINCQLPISIVPQTQLSMADDVVLRGDGTPNLLEQSVTPSLTFHDDISVVEQCGNTMMNDAILME